MIVQLQFAAALGDGLLGARTSGSPELGMAQAFAGDDVCFEMTGSAVPR